MGAMEAYSSLWSVVGFGRRVVSSGFFVGVKNPAFHFGCFSMIRKLDDRNKTKRMIPRYNQANQTKLIIGPVSAAFGVSITVCATLCRLMLELGLFRPSEQPEASRHELPPSRSFIFKDWFVVAVLFCDPTATEDRTWPPSPLRTVGRPAGGPRRSQPA